MNMQIKLDEKQIFEIVEKRVDDLWRKFRVDIIGLVTKEDVELIIREEVIKYLQKQNLISLVKDIHKR